MEDKFNLGKKIRALEKLKVNLPNDIAQIGQRFFQREFQKAEWENEKWAPRKNKKNKKHLLVKTGKLKQSLQNTIRAANYKFVSWGTDVPYAKYQNFGTDTIPKREFLGHSKELIKTIKEKIIIAYNKAITTT